MSHTPPARPEMSAVKLALACQQTRDRDNDEGLLRCEPIAIIGMACRFPGGDSLDSYWRLLEQRIDAVGEIPQDRWPQFDRLTHLTQSQRRTAQWGGFLPDVASFDAAYFGIAPREAAIIDPQHRLLLEVTWEALADAGLPYESLSGTRTGVYMGAYYRDYGELQMRHPERLASHVVSGNLGATATGRISYLLNLSGPNVVIDTACSSSLVAVHAACASLRAAESTLALAGGVSLILRPEGTLGLIEAGLLAPDGRCKTFDAAADGFVRGEGCGVLVLKRLADALRNGDRIHAVIRGTAVNHDGRSNFLTAPSGPAQEAVIRLALENARLEPAQVTYVEAHGTGTQIGDPIELEALANVYGERRAADNPCRVGSVKASIGHLEAAAGVSGLIKIVLAMRHAAIPPQLHFERPNTLATFGDSGLRIDAAGGPWNPAAGARIAGISGFGFGGTNAHVIVEQPPTLPSRKASHDDAPYVLTLSAASPVGLRKRVEQFSGWLSQMPAPAASELSDICYTAAARRSHHEHRVAVVGGDAPSLAEELSALTIADGIEAPTPRLAMVFSGQGTHWAGMGQDLAIREPVFRAALEECAAAMRPWTDWDLLDVLWSERSQEMLERTRFAQPAIFAIQVALSRLWESWGIVPAAVVGHSVGEIAAAVVAGIFSLSDAARLIVRRGELLDQLSGGGMLAVRGGEAELRNLLSPDDDVEFAALNAPSATVLSGSLASLQRLQARLRDMDRTCQMLPVAAAFHSRHVAPLEAELVRELAFLAPRAARLPFYSTVCGATSPGETLHAEYWRQNMRQTVRFQAAIQQLLADGFNVLLEVGPHAALAGSLAEIVRSASVDAPAQVLVQASMRRDVAARPLMLQSLASLYTAGCDPNWQRVFSAGARCVSLPNYPWQRERCWIETHDEQPVSGFAMPASADLRAERIESPFVAEPVYATTVSAAAPAELGDHRFAGSYVLPAAGMLELVTRAAIDERMRATTAAHEMETPLVLESIDIQRAAILDADAVTEIQFRIAAATECGRHVEMRSRRGSPVRGKSAWQPLLQAELVDGEHITRPPTIALGELRARCPNVVTREQFVDSMRRRGAEFGPRFSLVEEVRCGDGVAIGRIQWSGDPQQAHRESPLPCTLLDAAMQTAEAFAQYGGARGVGLPVRIERLAWYAPLADQLYCRVASAAAIDDAVVRYDLTLCDDQGRVCVAVQGLQLRRTTIAELKHVVGHVPRATLDRQTWRPSPAEDNATARLVGDFAIVGEDTDLRAAIANRIREASVECEVHEVSRTNLNELREKLSRRMAARESRPCCLVFVTPRAPLPAANHEPSSLRLAPDFDTLAALVRLASDFVSMSECRISIITRFSQAVLGGENPDAADLEIGGAALWGAAHAAALEHPRLKFTCLDLDANENSTDDAERVVRELGDSAGLPRRVAWRGSARYAAVIEPSANGNASAPTEEESSAACHSLCTAASGLIGDVALRQGLRIAPRPDEIEIEVESTGLNFRDVLRSLGMLPDTSDVLGAECAGRVARVGRDVTKFTEGQRVMAFVPRAFQTFVTAPAALAAPVPDSLGTTEAGANVVAFLTVHYGLKRLANLRAGERVLVHAGAGGVGLAAIQLCHNLGAEVIATAGSQEKRDYLESLGVAAVFDSRSLDFSRQVLELTAGRGVDVVLNSLSGDFVPASLAALAPGGRFVELGKRGVWTAEEMRAQRPDVACHVFDLMQVASESPTTIAELFVDVRQAFQSGAHQPLPQRTFAVENAAQALEHMQRARHIGKVALRWPRSSKVRSAPLTWSGPYLITGGMGALGLHAARWFAARGAKSLILLGRSAPADEASRQIQQLRGRGVDVRCLQCDVADPDALSPALCQIVAEMGPIRGVVHAAGVLDDGPITELTGERFTHVARAKIDALIGLDRALGSAPLEFFVLYSSLAAVTGWPGQANYAAANAAMDAIATNLRRRGRPTVTVHWGPWANAGMAALAEGQPIKRWRERGLAPLEDVDADTLLSQLLTEQPAEAIAAAVDWDALVSAFPGSGLQAFVPGSSVEIAPEQVSESTSGDWRSRLSAVAPKQQPEEISRWVQEAIVRVLGLPPQRALPAHRPLRELGLDSLLAVELRNVLCRESGQPLLTTFAYEHPTYSAMCEWFVAALTTPAASAAAASTSPTRSRAPDVAELLIDSMSDEQAEALLMAELAELEGRA